MVVATSEQTRQAVVIIHGIGEQRPLDTLRSFVRSKKRTRANVSGETVYDGVVSAAHKVAMAPDSARGRTDQRRFTVSWHHEEDLAPWIEELRENGPDLVRSRRSGTDFFEFYWAYHFRDTTWAHLRAWVMPMLVRPRSSVRHARLRGPDLRLPLRGLLLTAMLMFTVVAVLAGGRIYDAGPWSNLLLAAAVVVSVFIGSHLGLMTFVRIVVFVPVIALAFLAARLFADGQSFALVARNLTAISGIVLAVSGLSGLFLRGLGDAARYLSDAPDNVEETEVIRTKAVELLERLHDLQKSPGVPLYERIVVVGHSLGSVIAYDAVRCLWSKRNDRIAFPLPGSGNPDEIPVRRVEQLADELLGLQSNDSGDLQKTFEQLRTSLAEAKDELFQQVRDGTPSDRWLISDLVTLGSPLTYAQLMMAKSHEELRAHQRARIYAADPPNRQKLVVGEAHRRMRYVVSRHDYGTDRSILHQAACFAVVRWTNVYFAHDIVGGPLAGQFGKGIEDVCLPSPGGLGRLLAARACHSQYWRTPTSPLHRGNVAGSELSRRLLSAIITRRPVVVIRCVDKPSPETIAGVAGILNAAQGEGGIPVRLLVGERGPSPVGMWLPTHSRVVLTPAVTADIMSLLPNDSSVHVAVPRLGI